MAGGKGQSKGHGAGKSKSHRISGGKSVPVKHPPKRTIASRSGLQFPARRVIRNLRKSESKRIMTTAGVYLTAVLEYLTAEVFELAGNIALNNKRTRVQPRHLLIAIKQDEELNKFLNHVQFPWSGTMPTDNHKILFFDPKYRWRKDAYLQNAAFEEAQKERKEKAKAKAEAKERNKAKKNVGKANKSTSKARVKTKNDDDEGDDDSEPQSE